MWVRPCHASRAGADVGSREGIANRRPARWATVLDQLNQTTPPCMPNKRAWILYLSGVAAECLANRVEAQRLARCRSVNPCSECTVGFQADADARGACVPGWFKGQA
jgi:hypothetical protein